MKRATSVARDQLVSLGVCVGKFTHSDKFRLTIGALELLAAHAKHKVRPQREKLRMRRSRCSRMTLVFSAAASEAREGTSTAQKEGGCCTEEEEEEEEEGKEVFRMVEEAASRTGREEAFRTEEEEAFQAEEAFRTEAPTEADEAAAARTPGTPHASGSRTRGRRLRWRRRRRRRRGGRLWRWQWLVVK